MKTPRERRILVGRRDQRVGRVGEGLGAEVVAILNHQLEATGGAQPLDRGRVDHEDEGVLDDRPGACADLGQHGRGIHAWDVLAVERGQAEEDRADVGCDGACRHIEPGHRQTCARRPGVFRTMSFTSRTTASVRARLEPGGSWTTVTR